MRLNRFLAAAGVGSRRHCDELIAAGRVTVNGAKCVNFSFEPGPRDHVKVDGKPVRTAAHVYIALNKPRGFVSTAGDPHAYDTIFDLLPPNLPRMFNVGRLDAQTEGLLLLTNDGDLAQELMHPKFKIEKEYEVLLERRWNAELAPKLLKGILLEGKRAQFTRLEQISATRLRVVLRQGLNRQIRRMLLAVGYETKRLGRIRIGDLHLGDLPSGKWRMLTAAEVKSLRRTREKERAQ